MVTISHVVNKLINDSVYLQEAIGRGIASYGSVAKKLKPDIEDILGKEAAHYAIVAAIRRHAEKMQVKFRDIKFDKYTCEINLKTNVIYINVFRSPSLFDRLKKIYDKIKFENGDILHIIYGRNSASIVTNERYNKEIIDFLNSERVTYIKKNLVSLSLSLSLVSAISSKSFHNLFVCDSNKPSKASLFSLLFSLRATLTTRDILFIS